MYLPPARAFVVRFVRDDAPLRTAKISPSATFPKLTGGRNSLCSLLRKDINFLASIFMADFFGIASVPKKNRQPRAVRRYDEAASPRCRRASRERDGVLFSNYSWSWIWIFLAASPNFSATSLSLSLSLRQKNVRGSDPASIKWMLARLFSNSLTCSIVARGFFILSLW